MISRPITQSEPGPLPQRNLALELVRVTEAAALASGRWAGRGEKEAGDGAAVDAMRGVLATVAMRGTVVIGEGEKDAAPMLYNGETVGDHTGPDCDVAVDPVDGTTLLATGRGNAIAVLAVAPRGSMFDPSTVFYMDKLVTGVPDAAVHIDASAADNINAVATAKGAAASDVTVCVLDRPRHAELVNQIRATGARIKLISDGDVAGAIMAASDGTGVDLLLGVGGTPEGIIAACAVMCLGGTMQARLHPTTDEERRRLAAAALDAEAVLNVNALIRSDNVFFVATGITDGDLLKGVRYTSSHATTHSLVMRSTTRTVRWVKARHDRQSKFPQANWSYG